MTDGPLTAALSERVRKTLRANGQGVPMQQSLTTGAQPTGVGGVPKERLVGWYSKVLEGVGSYVVIAVGVRSFNGRIMMGTCCHSFTKHQVINIH